MQSPKSSFLDKLSSIGNLPEDTEEQQLHKRFLVYMGSLMSGGGLMWGSIALYFGLLYPSIIPYSYTAITVLNFTYFAFSKNFIVVRFLQILISLLLPFFFQWSLGGFEVTGAMMLWSLLALVGSLTFQSPGSASRWLIAYVVLAVVSGFIDPYVRAIAIDPPYNIRSLFFVINIVVISSIVVGLMLYFVSSRDQANDILRGMKDQLEMLVQSRTRELNEALAHLTAIIDNMADGLLVTDKRGRITRINPALAELYNLEHVTELLGQYSENLDANISVLLRKSLLDNEMHAGELELPQNRTGKAVASGILHKLDEADSNSAMGSLGSVTIIRDITQEKEVDRMKTDFISNVSHELRTPLTSVLGFAKIINKKFNETIAPNLNSDEKKVARAVEQVNGNLGIIVSEGERLTALINGVLDISKMEAGKTDWNMSTISMADVVDRSLQATSSLLEDKSFSITKEISPDLPEIVADQDRIIQVVINLLSNAIKFTGAGEVHVSVEIVAKFIQVTVRDSGIGIADTELSQVFEKFQQVGNTLTDKPQGTGLGLPICKQIITHHEGNIWVESELGKGSSFMFTLPLADSKSISESPEKINLNGLIASLGRHSVEDLSTKSSHDKVVLVVDDEINIRKLLNSELVDAGYKVLEAEDGIKALDILDTEKVHLVILDVMMPKMNGFDVAAVIKNNPHTMDIPIMIHSIVDDKERGFRIGVDKYITKTGDTENILEEVSILISQGPSHKKVLVLDENKSTVNNLVDVLQARGYNAVGSFSGDEGLELARKEKPDMVIVDSIFSEKHKVVQTLKFEKGLENVFFLVVGEGESNTND